MKRFVNAFGPFALCAATTLLQAESFSTLVTFDKTNGAIPNAPLVQGTDGDFYGTTSDFGNGTVFKISSSGVLTTLYSFCAQTGCTDGSDPLSGLIQATDGNFYGTTFAGGPGSHSYGTVYRITRLGSLTTLYSFCAKTKCADGANPEAGLMQAADGDFYGSTSEGGLNEVGTIFKITQAGVLTTLYSFCAQTGCTDGLHPSGLVEATDGSLLGTTSAGGASSACDQGCGTIFTITPHGTLTTLYSFAGTDGQSPNAIIQGTDGNLYGTTYGGGAGNAGTVFKITLAGALTTLYSFSALNTLDIHGFKPTSGLIQATDGNFYGTSQGGSGYNYDDCVNGCGTLFRITPTGTLTTLHLFCSQTDCGAVPYAGLIQATSGEFYGSTEWGGSDSCSAGFGCGTLFSLSIGLGSFVEPQTTSGKVGAEVKILGNALTGTTSVTFNGTPAAFSIPASSVITATVPVGATSGLLQVVAPRGTLSSNVPFTVVP
jgi:uncharacterized repeat protein (TIGR03803 family)